MSSVALESSENTYRLVLISVRDKKNKNIPAERSFFPTERDEGKLSVDIESLTTPEKTLSRWGAMYNAKQEFKDYNKWELYKLNVGDIKLIDKVINVIKDPIKYDEPEKGRPDNPAHGLIDLSNIKDVDLPEVVLKLRNLAKDNKVDVKMDEVDTLVQEYRRQWD